MLEIKKIEACEIQDLQSPKRVKKYILIFCTDGETSLVVDDKELFLKPSDVLTITSGQYHFYTSLSRAKGFILEFTLDYFCKNDTDIELIFQNGLFCHFDMNEVIAVSNPAFIETHLTSILDELDNEPFQYLAAIHSRIELILIEINRARIADGYEIWKPDALFLHFLELIRRNFDKNYSLSTIATKLNTTELKLNELAKTHAGKTAQNVIYGLIASEAKRLFRYEMLSVKEVAYRLGFNDPFYFSRFFKKMEGLSPSEFRSQQEV